jgi:ectoine hydroxylase-related dioxygenase (phytanoyl-CoA dioxygenase family)
MSHATLDDRTAFFRDNGYVHIPDVITGTELDNLRDVSTKIIEFASAHRVPQDDYQYRKNPAGEEVFYRLNYPKKRSIVFQALYGHPRLLKIFEGILGPNFVVTDDALVVKLPHSGTEFPWHRDTAGNATRAGDTLLVPGIDLDISNNDNGCVNVIPQSHLNPDIDIEALVSTHGFDIPGAVPLVSTPGDLSVHGGNTLHGSRPNLSGTTRRTIYIAAIDIDDYLTFYNVTPEKVRLEMRYMARGIQLRRSLYRDEEPYTWSGADKWRADLATDDFVDWGMPSVDGAR